MTPRPIDQFGKFIEARLPLNRSIKAKNLQPKLHHDDVPQSRSTGSSHAPHDRKLKDTCAPVSKHFCPFGRKPYKASQTLYCRRAAQPAP
jgi:hypothetical protein